MNIINNIEILPIFGKYDNNVIKISKFFAKLYNNQIKENYNHDFIINYLNKNNFIYELNKVNKTFEIIINEKCFIVYPTLFINENNLNALFEFKNNKNKSLNERKQFKFLFEDFNLKGKAGSFITKKISSNLKSAKEFIKGNIEIKNSKNIDELCNSICENLHSIINIDINKDEFNEDISEFIKTGNKSNINMFYDKLFNMSLETKFIDDVLLNINKFINEKTDLGEIKGYISDSDILDSIARSYNVDISIIKKRNESSSFIKKSKKFISIINKSLSTFFNICKSGIGSLAAYDIFKDGVISFITKIISFIIKNALSLISYLISQNNNTKQMSDTILKSSDSSVFEKTAAVLTKTSNYITSDMFSHINKIQEFIFNKIGLLSKTVENLPYINSIKIFICVLICYTIIKNILEIIKNISGIKKETSTESEKVFARFNKEMLKNNFGFDKILASEIIICILSDNIQNYIKNKDFSQDEIKRLNQLNKILIDSHSIKTKEGIKIFFNNF